MAKIATPCSRQTHITALEPPRQLPLQPPGYRQHQVQHKVASSVIVASTPRPRAATPATTSRRQIISPRRSSTRGTRFWEPMVLNVRRSSRQILTIAPVWAYDECCQRIGGGKNCSKQSLAQYESFVRAQQSQIALSPESIRASCSFESLRSPDPSTHMRI